MDGKSEENIQVLENILRSCVFDFGGHRENIVLCCQFSYNNNYHSNVDMEPLEALYRRGCRGWFEGRDVKPLGVDLVTDAQDRVSNIQAKFLAHYSRQNKYVDYTVRYMTCQTSQNVLS